MPFEAAKIKDHRYPEELEVSEDACKNTLKTRRMHVEAMIDDHLNAIERADEFQGRGIEEKLQVLMEEEPSLKQKDERCRMNGLT